MRLKKKRNSYVKHVPNPMQLVTSVNKNKKAVLLSNSLLSNIKRELENPKQFEHVLLYVCLHAASDGNGAVVRACLDRGVPVTISDWGSAWQSPIFHAASADVVDLLVKRGASVNMTDHCGRTPLWTLLMSKNVPLIRSLLAHGAHLNISDMGKIRRCIDSY